MTQVDLGRKPAQRLPRACAAERLPARDLDWRGPRQLFSFIPFWTPGRAPTRSPQAVTCLRPALSINAFRPA